MELYLHFASLFLETLVNMFFVTNSELRAVVCTQCKIVWRSGGTLPLILILGRVGSPVASGLTLDSFDREGGANFTALKVFRSCPLVLCGKGSIKIQIVPHRELATDLITLRLF
jgi:hypothetical protein